MTSDTEDPNIATLREALDWIHTQGGHDVGGPEHRLAADARAALAQLETELSDMSAVNDRIRTILDEAVSMMPVMPAQEALTLLEEHVHSLRMAVEISQQREPTQAEGDAHARKPDGSLADECFVPSGGWTGRRCRVCRRWVWGGPTACVQCADLARTGEPTDILRGGDAAPPAPAPGELAEAIRKMRFGPGFTSVEQHELILSAAESWQRLQWRPASEAPADHDVCWHCKDCLEPAGPPHCESCPAFGDCTDPDCEEEACAAAALNGGDDEEAPFVCPGCHAVAPERCLPGCIDDAIERDRQDAMMRGDYDDRDENGGDDNG